MGGVISGATVRVRPNVQQNPTPGVTARAPTTPTTTPTPPPSKAPRDTFDTPGSGPTTRKVVPPKPQVEAGVDDDDAIVVKSTAPSPEHAQADELFAVSNDERLVAAVRTRASQPGRIIDARTPPRLQRAYLEFLQARKLKDSEPNQREFAQLLDARRAYASRNGLGAMNADQERQFLAETALARLSVRALAGQKVTLGDGERWMISALSDSKVALSPSDAKLLERCNWTNQGLSYSLAEERGKNQLREAQRASEFRSTPGRPYKAVLNVEDVFQGDAQVNAFTLAAQAGGYSGEEIRLAIDQLKLENVTLFCRRDKDGETLITEKSQAASLEERGGQEFITYSVDSRGALALRDARVALAGGFGSVKAYRDDFQNTPATWVSNLVSEWVKNEQQWDLTQGKSQDPILGPLMRGKYDAMREIGQVATNLTQLGEMMAQEGKQFLQTGNLLTTLNDNPEVVRYFDAESERFGNTFDALAKTYAEKEDTVMGQVARGFVGSIPKVAVSAALGPSGALLYTGAKDFHSAPNELARDLTLELLSIVTGPLVGAGSQALEGTISRTAPKLVDTALKQFVVQEVTDRGFSAVAGATQELLTTVGPAGMQRLLSKNGQPLSEADERKVSEQLTDFAYRRALWTGMLTGLILPSRPSRDADTAVLNTKDSALEGPLYRTEGNAQQSKLYASVKVPEANGKQRVEFIEVSPDNPRVKAALKEKPAQLVPQVDADTKLAISRYTNRLDDAGRKDLAAKANQYAAAKVRLDAETGVRRDAVKAATKSSGTKSTRAVSMKPSGTKSTKAVSTKSSGTKSTKAVSMKPSGTKSTKAVSTKSSGTKSTKAVSTKPSGTKSTKAVSTKSSGTKSTKAVSTKSSGTKSTKAVSQKSSGTKSTKAVSPKPSEQVETSKRVPLRQTENGVVLDGARVSIADRTLVYPELRYTPSEQGPVSRFNEYLTEKGIKTNGSRQIAEGNSRIVLEHPAFPDKVIKIFSKNKVPQYNEQVPYLLQRELALETFLKDSGVTVAKIDRDPALISRGIVIQEKMKGVPYSEVRDTLPAAVREQMDARIQGLKDRYNDALFKDHAARSGKPLVTREAPNKPITPAGLDLNIGNVWIDTSKPTPELILIDW